MKQISIKTGINKNHIIKKTDDIKQHILYIYTLKRYRMNAIQEVIHLMNNEDIKAFSLYLDKKNKRKDVRNTELFDLLKTDDINVEKIGRCPPCTPQKAI